MANAESQQPRRLSPTRDCEPLDQASHPLDRTTQTTADHPSTASTISTSQGLSSSPPVGSPPSSCRLRSRLLNTLGIEKKQKQPLSTSSQKEQKATLDRRNSFHEQLKSDYGVPVYRSNRGRFNSLVSLVSSSISSAESSSLSPQRRSRGVSFDQAVQVQLIPSCNEYSSRMRRVLWMAPIEMQENAARNW